MAQYDDFISQNIAPADARRIGVYNAQGNRVGIIPLSSLAFPKAKAGAKLYSFGALADIHTGESTANDDYVRA